MARERESAWNETLDDFPPQHLDYFLNSKTDSECNSVPGRSMNWGEKPEGLNLEKRFALALSTTRSASPTVTRAFEVVGN